MDPKEPESENIDDLSPEELEALTNIPEGAEQIEDSPIDEPSWDLSERPSDDVDPELQRPISAKPPEIVMENLVGEIYAAETLRIELEELLTEAKNTNKPNFQKIQEVCRMLTAAMARTPGLNKIRPCVIEAVEESERAATLTWLQDLSTEQLKVITEAEALLDVLPP